MTTGAPPTDRRPDGAGPVGRPWRPFAILCGLGLLVYAAGLNRNGLYLSMLFSSAAVATLCLERVWSRLLTLGAFVYLAVVPVHVPDLGRLYPAPRDIPGADRYWCAPIGPGETWIYHFTLAGLRRYDAGGGANGRLFVDGRNLADLVVEIDGRPFGASEFATLKTGMDHVSIPLDRVASGRMTVSLRQKGPRGPRIFHGTEVHGSQVYGDAVWLEFDKGDDRIIYESKRAVAPSTASLPPHGS
jgi:hypothetical protein